MANKIFFNCIPIPRKPNRVGLSGCYVIYDGDGVPLYCGISDDVLGRLGTHRTALRHNCKFANNKISSPSLITDNWYAIIIKCECRELSELLEVEVHNIFPSLLSTPIDGFGGNRHSEGSKLTISSGLSSDQHQPWLNRRVKDSPRLINVWILMPKIYDIWLRSGRPKYGRLRTISESELGCELCGLSKMVNMFTDGRIHQLLVDHELFFGSQHSHN